MQLLVFAALSMVVGLIIGYVVRKSVYEKQLTAANQTAAGIISTAKTEAETAKKEAILEAKEESHRYRENVEDELKQRRSEVQRQEDRLLQRETSLDHKDTALEKRETAVGNREHKLDQQAEKLHQAQQTANDLVDQRQAELEKVAQMSHADAKAQLLAEMKDQLKAEREEANC